VIPAKLNASPNPVCFPLSGGANTIGCCGITWWTRGLAQSHNLLSLHWANAGAYRLMFVFGCN
jgi:hypothetical protein